MTKSCGPCGAEAGTMRPRERATARNRPVLFLALVAALTLASTARGGHEMPVYPSFYPHEIDIRTVNPDEALAALREARLHAYLGHNPRVMGALPEAIGTVKSLGSFVVVEVNPRSPLTRDEPTTCAVAASMLRNIAGHGGDVVFHPYPVTPFDGDYLYFADLADAAKARWLARVDGPAPRIKVKTEGALAENLVDADQQTHDVDWDAAVETVDAGDLVAASTVAVNGWIGPPWIRSGWFHAHRLLTDSLRDADARSRAAADVEQLESGDYDSAIERINLERDFVALVTAGCGKTVAGYTVKRQYFNADYSAGIENIGYDAIEGLYSPMFLRTAKLKDFPWNGWLVVGIDARPTAAWNPMAGFTDRFGRLAWYALSDTAVLPAPNDAGWTFNRISDVQAVPSQ